jgi:hypothetical protein
MEEETAQLMVAEKQRQKRRRSQVPKCPSKA